MPELCMKPQTLKLLTAFAVSSALAAGNARAASPIVTNPAQTSLGVIAGGDEGEGLDLDGNFLYALSFGANIGETFQVRDATFQALISNEVEGANLIAGNRILNWYVVDYGETENDDNLERATSSIRWSDANSPTVPEVVLTLDGLQIGGSYQLQLMFGEQCCNRGFDVFVNGSLIVKDFNPGVEHGGIANRLQEALITHQYLAAGTTLEIRLDGRGASTDYTDHNAIFNAITVELVAAPGDADGDGLQDAWENLYFGNLSQGPAGDPDADGLTNAEELAAGTNPTLADTDKDGLTDAQEVKTYGTNPSLPDTDADGLSDKDEVITYLTDPRKKDTDGDLLSDSTEVLRYGTDPKLADTDGDGFDDYAELHLLSNPRNAARRPKFTTANRFTGPDEGQGLDFAGSFPYALSFGNNRPGGQVYDAFFTADNVDGATITTSFVADGWNQGVNFGESPEQQVLSSVISSIRWSAADNAIPMITLTFANLNVGARYKLQLLFGEYLWARGFNIFVSDHLIAREFAPYQWQGGLVGPGGATPRDTGAVLTHTFVATSDTITIVMDGRGVTDPTMADHNAIVNGATLELEDDAADTDADGLPDAWERLIFGNLNAKGTDDTDADGLTNAEEYSLGTDGADADTDGDGLNDGREVNTTSTDPFRADSDNDGLMDGAEVDTYHTDPNNVDSDADGLSDAAEVNTHHTDPTKADTDGDGPGDGVEIVGGSNPLVADPRTTVSNIEIQAISGGDPGEGLDLEGNFVYAFNVSSAGAAGQAGDANFTADNAPGIKVTAPNNIPAWDDPAYGDSEADDVIEKVMQSIRYGSTVKVELSGLVPGSTYKVQLLFYEQCCITRGFNVYVDGETVAQDFSPPAVQGGVNNTASGAVVSAEFVTQRDNVVILATTFGRQDPGLTDPNAILDGVTLEAISLATKPTLTLTKLPDGRITIATDSTLQSANDPAGPYTSLPDKTITLNPATGGLQKYYRGIK